MYRTIKVALTVVAISIISVLAAHASKSERNDALAIRKADITLIQAIQAAEQHVHGKAVKAEFERGKNGWVFDVEVVTDKKTYDVAVDPTKGTIITADEDKTDTDDSLDKED